MDGMTSISLRAFFTSPYSWRKIRTKIPIIYILFCKSTTSTTKQCPCTFSFIQVLLVHKGQESTGLLKASRRHFCQYYSLCPAEYSHSPLVAMVPKVIIALRLTKTLLWVMSWHRGSKAPSPTRDTLFASSYKRDKSVKWDILLDASLTIYAKMKYCRQRMWHIYIIKKKVCCTFLSKCADSITGLD